MTENKMADQTATLRDILGAHASPFALPRQPVEDPVMQTFRRVVPQVVAGQLSPETKAEILQRSLKACGIQHG